MKGKKELCEESGHKALAMAIVSLAARDYENAIVKFEKNPLDHEAKSDYLRTIRFFKSGWYCLLCEIPGEVIMEQIQDKIWKAKQKKTKKKEKKKNSKRGRPKKT